MVILPTQKHCRTERPRWCLRQQLLFKEKLFVLFLTLHWFSSIETHTTCHGSCTTLTCKAVQRVVEAGRHTTRMKLPPLEELCSQHHQRLQAQGQLHPAGHKALQLSGSSLWHLSCTTVCMRTLYFILLSCCCHTYTILTGTGLWLHLLTYLVTHSFQLVTISLYICITTCLYLCTSQSIFI